MATLSQVTAVEHIRDLRSRGFSQSEIARKAGVARGYVSHVLTGRVTPSPNKAEAISANLRRIEDTGATKITVWQTEEAAQKSEGRTTTFEQPATARDRQLLSDYQDEVMKLIRGEPYDLTRFEGKKIYVGRKGGRHRISLETDPDILLAYAEQGEMDEDRVFKYELIDTPGSKGRGSR